MIEIVIPLLLAAVSVFFVQSIFFFIHGRPVIGFNRLAAISALLPEAWHRYLNRLLVRSGIDCKEICLRSQSLWLALLTHFAIWSNLLDLQFATMESVLYGGLLAPLSVFLLFYEKGARRIRRVVQELPAFIDLVAQAVEAGSDPVFGMTLATHFFPFGPLGDEIEQLLTQIKLGTPRRTALLTCRDRLHLPALSGFIGCLLRAEAHGGAIAGSLREESTRLKARQLLDLEQSAQRSGIWLLFPLVCCFAPAMLLIVALPVVLSLSNLGIVD